MVELQRVFEGTLLFCLRAFMKRLSLREGTAGPTGERVSESTIVTAGQSHLLLSEFRNNNRDGPSYTDLIHLSFVSISHLSP